MDLLLDSSLLANYTSRSQQARVLTETWAEEQLFCPNCTSNAGLKRLPNNQPVGDLYCPSCAAQYELKAKSSAIGRVIQDGAYGTMMERLSSDTNPHLIVLRYERKPWQVRDVLAVPNFFFVPQLIKPRPPLPPTARRAGWVGCTIQIGDLPSTGRIPIVTAAMPNTPSVVRELWSKSAFLNQINNKKAKTWLLATMNCIEQLETVFSLPELYAFEAHLSKQFPDNNHVRDKLRQQLQVLRDRGYLRFLRPGVYERL